MAVDWLADGYSRLIRLTKLIKYDGVGFQVGSSPRPHHVTVTTTMKVVPRELHGRQESSRLVHIGSDDPIWDYASPQEKVVRTATTTLYSTHNIDTRGGDKEILLQIMQGVIRMFAHEAQENFYYDGERIFDPHTYGDIT